MRQVNWHDETTFDVDGRMFGCFSDLREMGERWQKDSHFVAKSKETLDVTIDAVQLLKPQSIIELGVFKGGSAIFLHSLCQPRKMLTVELDPQVEELEQYRRSLEDDSLVSAYELSQSDTQGLAATVQQTFQGEPIDLVIDDASHDYHHTRASFNMLFPLLRPGGYYIIEDWAWGYLANSLPDEYTQRTASLIPLAFELTSLAGMSTSIIKEMKINQHHLIIQRGEAELDAADFDYSSLADLRPETYLDSAG
jgi:predicted O-methyltransferase YrrM